MIWMQANPLQGSFEKVCPKIETFLGPEMATSEASAIYCQFRLVNPGEAIRCEE